MESDLSFAPENTVAVPVTQPRGVNRRGIYLFVKRSQDIILSLLALCLLSPILFLAAFAVYIDDPHASPIFKQKRVGKNGKVFTLYKFRSMYANAEEMKQELADQNEMDGPVFKIKNDPRITHVGKFIRKVSIDELPQLVNILRGDMSIVGPRPALPEEVAEYGPFEKQRLAAAPGLTCIWQVQPNRNDISFHEWMQMDAQYIEKQSFWIDWKLIFLTFRAVLGGHGE